ncbi:MAG TPA: hypothetical protein V6D25_16060 [Leptolyngbyaceae cyanobacterium]
MNIKLAFVMGSINLGHAETQRSRYLSTSELTRQGCLLRLGITVSGF